MNNTRLIPVVAVCIKIGYGTEREAMDAARKLRDRKLNAYHCANCGSWHIGHGETGRRSKYRFYHNRAYIGRAYHDRLDAILAELGF
jgi:hypothetical protein